jgi:LmbE family N-acetylglucosaminyl deacetylase
MKRLLIVLLAAGAIGESMPRAQMRVAPLDDKRGHVALGLALRHLSNTGVFMMATAHPDDENNALLVMLNRGQGYRTALATATRGNGGQNEIGPEIFEALGVLRTEELAAVHRFDGAEQYFTRAVDFGYSFSVDETFEKWGREEILGDFVRLIRTIRPDVIAGLSPTGAGGGQHHEASAILAREAFKAAADPTKFPEQLKDGLRVWQPKKFYNAVGFAGAPRDQQPAARRLTVNLARYDWLLGKTYAEIGSEARSMHKCQGTVQLLSVPGPATASYELAESTLNSASQREENTMFEGIDTSLAGLAQLAGARPPKELTQALNTIATEVQMAQRRFDQDTDDAAVPPLLNGLRAVRALRGQLRALQIDEGAKYEIDFRLRQKEREFQQAIVLANAVKLEALADDGVVVPGQPVRVSVIISNSGGADVTVKQVKFDGFEGDSACALTAAVAGVIPGGGRGRGGVVPQPIAAGAPLSTLRKDQIAQCDVPLTIPAKARISEPYWQRAGEAGRYTFDDDAPFGLPYRPTSFYVQATLTFGTAGEEVFDALPVQYRYQGEIFSGEKRSELLVVPAMSVHMTPEIAIVPVAPAPPPPAPVSTAQGTRPATPGANVSTAGSTATATTGTRRPAATRAPAAAPPPAAAPAGVEREVRVTVVNDTKGEANGNVTLQLPDGWNTTPREQALKFSREDESQTIRFVVRAAANAAAGEYPLAAAITADGQTYSRGYQIIEYPHIRRQHIYEAARTTMKVIDVKVASGLTVGYIMGVGDQVPSALEQLGAKVEMLGPDDLAWGNLSRFQTIVAGVRAYERRADLRANNNRLLDYVHDGGMLIVQYNKFEFNAAQYGPYPAKVTADRVTDERAPVKVLAPNDPIFNAPNKLTAAVWDNWVQERGLYFLGDHDSRYRDLVSLEDPFPNNAGEKQGALVAAPFGKGRWVYVGLGLWRELPAGVDGAYQLLANLISLGH